MGRKIVHRTRQSRRTFIAAQTNFTQHHLHKGMHMSDQHIDYFLAPQSPWTYLGHDRLVAMAASAGATVRVRPVDLGKIFPLSGGLPLPKRAPQRQAYRLVELARFSEYLNLPLHVQPQFFPVAGDPAARLIIAVQQAAGAAAALDVTGRVLRAVWAEQRDIANTDTLKTLLRECGLASHVYEASLSDAVQTEYEAHTQAAIDAQVFGSPSYVLRGELFWGQDRLAFLERALQRA
jgi:2-hydroxychromene-2-carboxylate isomerase